MNKLDQRLERLAFELFTAQGLDQSLVEFKIKELKICVDHGYNSRAELIMIVTDASKAVAA